MKVLVTQSRPTLCNLMDCSPPGSCPWNFPGKNTEVGSYPFLQGISPIQGSNPGLLHYRQILYSLSHQGSPKRICVKNLYLQFLSLVWLPYLCVLHPQIQPTVDKKYFFKFQKTPKSKTLSSAGNYLHSIYIVFTTI